MNGIDLPFGVVEKLDIQHSLANAKYLDYSDVRCPEIGGDLHAAAAVGDIRKVEQILRSLVESKMGALNSRNFAGQTPLHLAARSGAGDVVGCLLVAKADANSFGDRGERPLHEAASTPQMHRSLEVAWRLIDAGAVVNQPDTMENTPLHYAVHSGFISLCLFLLERQANLASVNRSQVTPLDVARANDHHELVWRLREFELLSVCLDTSNLPLSSKLPLSQSCKTNIQVWARANASSADICGRIARILPEDVHLAWSRAVKLSSNLCWHECELFYPNWRSGDVHGAGRHAPDQWVTPTHANDFRTRAEILDDDHYFRLKMRILPNCTWVGDHASLNLEERLSEICESQPWRVAFSSKFAQLAWTCEDVDGWSMASLPKRHPLSDKITQLFTERSCTSRSVVGDIRLLRHRGWQQQFETMLSALMGASSQPVSDDSELQSLVNKLCGLPGDHAGNHGLGYKAFAASAFQATGRECHEQRYVELSSGERRWADPKCEPEFFEARLRRYHQEIAATFDQTTKGFDDLHFALVWQGAGASGNLRKCLGNPTFVQQDLFGLPSPIHVTKSLDYVEGCGHRPAFLDKHYLRSTSQDDTKLEVDGTVFLFLQASRHVFPLSSSRSYTRHFDPEADIHDGRYFHRGLVLPPGYDSHVFQVNGGKPPAHARTRNCCYASLMRQKSDSREPMEEDEFVAMHPAQLLPIAAINFSTEHADGEPCSTSQLLRKCSKCRSPGLLYFANTSATFCDECKKRCPQGVKMTRCSSCDYQCCSSCL